MKTRFETETCSRCNGSGSYSYCQTYGSKCFKCAGSGRVLSKRGAVAKAYHAKLCMVPASQVKLGDRIAATGITRGCQLFSYVGTVVEIRSREAVRTIVKTARQDSKTLDVSYTVKYSQSEGFSVLGSSGATVEHFDTPGYTEAGTVVERYTEYCIKTDHSKYGQSSQTVSGEIRTYPANNEQLIALAVEYQNSLTKQGTVRKTKGAKCASAKCNGKCGYDIY